MIESQSRTGTEVYFNSSTRGRVIHKNSNYFEIYDRYLERYKGRTPTIIEIGVQHGGSVLMWDAYFGGDANIVGLDILQDCKKFEEKNVRIFIGDQSDEKFLRDVIAKVGKVDIIVDDGSHVPSHQIKSFKVLFYDALAEDGVYICEDCHSSYQWKYGGGLRRSGTFIEFAKRLCDQVNAWAAQNPALVVDDATRWIKSVTFFGSVVVFEKARMSAPRVMETGEQKIDLERPFRTSKLSALIMPLKRSNLIQGLVRRIPFLWRIMRKLLRENQ